MRSRLPRLLVCTLLAVSGLTGLGLAASAPASAAAAVFPVPTSSAGLGRIVTAPNGNLWFIEAKANKLGRVTPAGAFTELPLFAEFDSTTVKDLDVAPDGTIWVLYNSGQYVAGVNDAGTVTRGPYDIGDFGQKIRVGLDGTPWIVVSYADDYVVRIVGDRVVQSPNSPECDIALARAADGSFWCSEQAQLTHLDATASGGTTYPANRFAAYPYSLAAGPVGSIWLGRYNGGTIFTSASSGEVGYLDASSGAVTAFGTGERTAPASLVRGPDNAMWFASIGAAKGIGHVDASGRGALTQVGGYSPTSLTFGTDGAAWFTDSTNNVIVRVPTSELQVTNVDPGAGSVFAVGADASGRPATTLRTGRKPVTVKKGKVAVALSCPATATSGCSGSLTLATAAKVRKAGRKKGPKTNVAVTRSASFSIPAGRSATVKVKISGKGGRYLARRGTTKLLVRVGGTPIGKIKVRR